MLPVVAVQNLEFWAGMLGLSPTQEELESRLAEAGLGGFAHERVQVFSRGMVQRLALARVFLSSPRLIFLDEPSTGLDAESTARLQSRIQQAAREGAAVVWVSHDVARDAPAADRVLGLDRGKAVFLGAPGDYLRERPC
jgi:heme exporter protein A